MKLDTSYRREGALGIFELAGSKDFASAKATWERIRTAIRNDKLTGVLVFDNAVSTLNGVEVLDLVQWLLDTRFPYDVKIAIVDPKLPAGSNNAFGETLIQNRGWSLIRVFAEEKKGREWLFAMNGVPG